MEKGESNKVWRVPYKSPYTLRDKFKMSLWWFVEALFFKPSLHKMNGWRCFLLRLFGAKIGANTFIQASAKIWFPWNLEIGVHSGFGFDALIYNLDKVIIGDYSTVTHRCHVNTGSHDFSDPAFALVTKPVTIGDNVFIGADSYISPGIDISDMVIVGARSVATKNLPSNMICVGHPCQPIKERESV